MLKSLAKSIRFLLLCGFFVLSNVTSILWLQKLLFFTMQHKIFEEMCRSVWGNLTSRTCATHCPLTASHWNLMNARRKSYSTRAGVWRTRQAGERDHRSGTCRAGPKTLMEIGCTIRRLRNLWNEVNEPKSRLKCWGMMHI